MPLQVVLPITKLRRLVDGIILVKLQLNPQTVFIGDVEQLAYQVSIIGAIDPPDDSGYLPRST